MDNPISLTPSEAVRELGLTHVVVEYMGYLAGGKEIGESVKNLHSKGKISRENYEKYISLIQCSY